MAEDHTGSSRRENRRSEKSIALRISVYIIWERVPLHSMTQPKFSLLPTAWMGQYIET